jgi:hypothetical protein
MSAAAPASQRDVGPRDEGGLPSKVCVSSQIGGGEGQAGLGHRGPLRRRRAAFISAVPLWVEMRSAPV